MAFDPEDVTLSTLALLDTDEDLEEDETDDEDDEECDELVDLDLKLDLDFSLRTTWTCGRISIVVVTCILVAALAIGLFRLFV